MNETGLITMFTYEFYHQTIVQLLEAGYCFSKFDMNSNENQTIYLRHDVDIDIWGSLELGNIEQINGVKSIFFFQPNAELYNVFSKECTQIIEKLNLMGHEIGLHIDAALFDKEEELDKYITDSYIYYSKFIPLSKVISFHRPAPFILNSDIKINGFINTYDKKFFKDIAYVSDSNRREFWDQENWKDALAMKKSMQLLTHPIWWGPYNQSVSDAGNNYTQKYVNYCKRALSRTSGSFSIINNWINGGER